MRHQNSATMKPMLVRIGKAMLLWVVMVSLVAGRSDRTLARESTVIIADETFAEADWEQVIVQADFGAGAVAGQEQSGGNPGSFRTMTHTMPAPPGVELAEIYVAHIFTGASYSPGTQGAINQLAFQQDSRMVSLSWPEAFVTTQVALRQDGRIFKTDTFIRTLSGTTWESSTLDGLDASQFFAVDNSGDHPDFSSSGSDIEFGYVRINGRLAASPVDTPDDLIIDHAIDNWSVTIIPEQAAGIADLVVSPASPTDEFYVNFSKSTLPLLPLGTPTGGLSILNQGPDVATSSTARYSFGVPDRYTKILDDLPANCDPTTETCTFGDLNRDAGATLFIWHRYLAPIGAGAYHGRASFRVEVTSDGMDPSPADAVYRRNYELFFCDDGQSLTCPILVMFCLRNFESLPRGSTLVDTIRQQGVRVKAAADVIFDLPVYYDLREAVMANRVGGRHYIALYETHGSEITTLLLADETLADEAIEVILLWEPNIKSLVEGDGSATITQAQIDALHGFLANLSAVGSSPLQQAIAAELTALGELDGYVGQTMSAVQGAVLGEIIPPSPVYLPLVSKD